MPHHKRLAAGLLAWLLIVAAAVPFAVARRDATPVNAGADVGVLSAGVSDDGVVPAACAVPAPSPGNFVVPVAHHPSARRDPDRCRAVLRI
jgi:hypothetical protein